MSDTQVKTFKVSSNENKIEFNGRVKRLYLTDIVKNKLINRSDIRSIRKWCRKNSINIVKDLSGEYVFEQDFDLAYNTPLITSLRQKYGTEWQSVYPYYINGELYKLVDIKNNAVAKTTRYIPKGNVSSSIQSKKIVR